jgi:hypothetical protein
MKRFLVFLVVLLALAAVFATELPPLTQYNLSDFEKLTGKKSRGSTKLPF